MLEQKQERAAALPREAEKKAIKALQKELAALQQPLRAAGVPVLLVFEGWSAAGKGSMIAKVISEMDPRGYQVYSAAEPTDEEARRPLLWPFWRDLPPRGRRPCWIEAGMAGCWSRWRRSTAGPGRCWSR